MNWNKAGAGSRPRIWSWKTAVPSKIFDEMMIYPRQDILHAFIISGRQVFYGSRMRPTIDWEQDPTHA